jgi:site-specific DNA-methyltransferase (adenine-specific)
MSNTDNTIVAIAHGVEIHHCDCLVGLRNLPDASVHAVITDPPYFIEGYDNEWNNKKSNSAFMANMQSGQRFSHDQGKRLHAFLAPIAAEILRVLKPGGFCLMFSQGRLHHRTAIALEDAGFEIRDMAGWTYYGQPKAQTLNRYVNKSALDADKKDAILDSMKGRKTCQLAPMIEPIVVAQKPISEPTIWQNWAEHEIGLLDVSQRLHGKFPGQLMEFAKPGKAEKGASNDHPTVKPLALMEHLIRLFTKEGQTVVDPFMGSGTTGLAALNSGRQFIGFEQSEHYVDIASARMSLSTVQSGDPANKIASNDNELCDISTDTSNAKALSQFYTPLATANWCFQQLLERLPANDNYNFIEPSAGRGVFMDAVQPYGSVIGFDIDPKRDDIIKIDFLSDDTRHHLPSKWQPSNCIMIGNPPFGVKNGMAMRFLNEGFAWADTVAFVLPKTFRRFGVQSKVQRDMRLIADLDLPSNEYEHSGRSTKVDCCFQIWTRLLVGQDIRLKSKPACVHPHFEIVQSRTPARFAELLKHHWDFVIPRSGNGQYGLVARDFSGLNTKRAWVFIRVRNPKAYVLLPQIDFKRLSREHAVTIGGVSHANIVRAYQGLLDLCPANDN